MRSVCVSYLLDSALPEPSLSLSLCVQCLLVVYLLDSALPEPSLYLSLCVRWTLVIYLFACLVNFFLKFFHSLQFLTDFFHITHESFLGGSAFGLWSAWRYGDFWRFGDHQHFLYKMVFYIETRQLDCDVTMLLLWIRCRVCVCVRDARNCGHRQPIRVEGPNSQTYLS